MSLLMCTSLQNVPSIAAAIVASTDDVSAPSVHCHSVPGSLHRTFSTRTPLIDTRVVAVGLLQVGHPSPATCDVDLPIDHCSSVGIHLNEPSVIHNNQLFSNKINLSLLYKDKKINY